MNSLKPELLKLTGLTISGIAFAACGNFSNTANMSVEIVKAIAPNFAHQYLSGIDYKRFRDFIINKDHPDNLNHDIERLMKDALMQAFYHLETKYIDKLQQDNNYENWKKYFKRPYKDIKLVFKLLRQNLIREEDYQKEFGHKIADVDKIEFSLNDNLSVNHWKNLDDLINELFKVPQNNNEEEWNYLKLFFEKNLPYIFDLSFKEALKDEKNLRAFKAFQILALESITTQNKTILSNLNDIKTTLTITNNQSFEIIGTYLNEKVKEISISIVENFNSILNELKNLKNEIKEGNKIIIQKLNESQIQSNLLYTKTIDFFSSQLNKKQIQPIEIFNELNESKNERKASKLKKSSLGIFYNGKIIGRENELLELTQFLAESESRVICINGIGGIGKTRLAYEFTKRHIDNFDGGYWFVDLMDCSSDAEFQAQVLESICFVDKVPPGLYRDYFPTIFEEKKIYILIFDNFEQLVGISDPTLEYWILNSPERVKFLITTTKTLKLNIEIDYLHLEGINGSDENGQYCLQLLLQKTKKSAIPKNRLNELENYPEYLNKIVDLLQGIPLAIEIVAAQLIEKNPAKVIVQLEQILDFENENNLKPTHSTLAKTIDWSFNLLPLEQQKYLILLSTFRDGFDLHAVSNILNNHSDNHEQILHYLITNSFVYVENYYNWNRYKLLNVIMKFCTLKYHQLPIEIRNEILEKKRVYYLKYAEKYISRLSSEKGSDAAEIILKEKENFFFIQDELIKNRKFNESGEFILSIAKVLELKLPSNLRIERLSKTFLLIEKESKIKMTLAYELSQAYLAAGLWDKWIEILIEAKNLCEKYGNYDDFSKIYKSISAFYFERGQPKRAMEFGLKAKEYNDLGSNETITNANIIDSLANLNARFFDFESGLNLLYIAEEILTSKSDYFQLVIHYNREALIFYFKGNINKAIESLNKAYHFAKTTKNIGWIPAIETNLALMYSELGKYELAIDMFKLAETEQRELGRLHWQAVNYGGWGRTLLMLPDFKNNSDIQIKSLEFINKAIKASEKVFYPENLTMHLGDLARWNFKKRNFHEAFQNALKAVSYEYKILTNRSKRHYSNLTILACSSFEIGFEDKFYEAFEKIIKIRKSIDYTLFKELPKIIEDNELLEEYNEKFNYSIKRKLINYFENARINAISRKWAFQKLSNLCGETRYEHPWYFLKDDILNRGERSILILGYGSLINKTSALRTFNEKTINNGIPAISFGTRRIFNYQMTNKVSSRDVYKNVIFPENYSCLNIQVTGLVSDFCNGIIYEIPIEELDGLCDREDGYDLIEVPCIKWNDKKPIEKKVYILSAEERYKNGRKLINNHIDPHPTYLNDCKIGAKNQGEEFYTFWKETTFLSDGIKKITKL